MIRFRHGEMDVRVPAGGRWSPSVDASDKQSYRDTPAAELRRIVAEIEAGEPWRTCVGRHYAEHFPWLHRVVTSPSRDLFFREYPPAPGSRVLDIGSGWGQLALPLARNHFVTALEPTPERLAFVEAAAKQEGSDRQMCFVQADFVEVEFESSFDLALCIGVLEWVPKFRDGPALDVQRDFLARCRAVLAPDGRLVVAIENRLGLKYLLGARDDHTGLRMVSVFDAALAAAKFRGQTGAELRAFTYALPEYAGLFRAAGFHEVTAFAAFPDYKLPELILPLGSRESLMSERSDRAFRKADEFNERLLGAMLPPEHDGIDGSSLPNQAEIESLYRILAKCGVAQHFAPSFYFILG